MDIKMNQDIQADIEKTKADAENLIRNIFPQRIATFKALQAAEDFSGDVSPACIKRLNGLKITEGASEKTEDVILQGNARVQKLLCTLKPHYIQMYKDFELIKTCLVHTIPKIEDGNNFGVDVLLSVLDKIVSWQDTSLDFNYLGLVIAETRAKAIKKMLKHPLVDEYKNVLEQLDELNLLKVQRYCQFLHRNYMMAYDLIMKNIEKVTTPRTANNSENMY